jgi:glycosyltransferase involved in cell wall biosynthesis
MKMLVDSTENIGVDVIFAGAGGTNSDYEAIRNYCSGKPHITFTGKYDYNSEILGLYERVDCVYSVYDADNPNVRIALPNKLYESIECELPIIVAKQTYLAELVKEWGVGIAVSHKSVEELKNAILTLKNDKSCYEKICNNCKDKKNKFNSEISNKKLLQFIEHSNTL